MMRKYWLDLGPSLLVALGIILATLVAERADGSGWWVMAGPVLLALFVVCADLFEAWLSGEGLVPSPGLLIMSGEIVAAGFIVALPDPGSVAPLIPIFGAACWIRVVSRSGGDQWACRYF